MVLDTEDSSVKFAETYKEYTTAEQSYAKRVVLNGGDKEDASDDEEFDYNYSGTVRLMAVALK